jgi:Helix-turn-helix.
VYKRARKRARLTIEEAAFRLHVAPRTLAKYEAGENTPPPEVVLAMSREYRAPELVARYCRQNCAIGQAQGYEVLDRVNLDPPSVMLKLMGEMAEAQGVLQKMLELVVNKNRREDFSNEEWTEFVKCFHEFLDVEHNIAILKLSLGAWYDIAELVAQHNRKCIERGYTSRQVNMAARVVPA